MPLFYHAPRLLILLVLFCASTALSQPFVQEINPFTVRNGAVPFLNPFSGGNNNPEVQLIDIDGDGDKDLFALNSDGTYYFYRNTGGSAPGNFALSPNLLPGLIIQQFFFFYDLDADGDYDNLTGGPDNAILVYKNNGSASNPSFSTAADTLKDESGSPVLNEGGCNPVICDVDGDSDGDLILGNTVGTLTLYQNTGTAGNYRFRFISSSWQNLIIVGGGKTNLHGASSLDFCDFDGDGDFDLLWGDFFSKSLYYIRNNGTPALPDLALLYRVFPANADSVSTSGFNMPRTADIDQDGDFDLFVSVLYDPTVPQSLMLFRNAGTAQLPDLRLATSDFFQTADAGIESVPTFSDIDGDGDADMFMGNAKNPKGTIYFFRRDGTPGRPEYVLADTQFAGIANELSVAPAFADLDADGDPDLLVGFFDGTVGWYRNTGNRFQYDFRYQGLLHDSAGTAIDAGLYARPHLTDANLDGLPDLLLGGFNGKVVLYQNRGTAGAFIFTRNDNYFGGIDVGENAAAMMHDIAGDTRKELIIGNRAGELIVFTNTGNSSIPAWQLQTGILPSISAGNETAPAFTDADGDGDADLFLGNVKGGICFFRNNNITGIRSANPSAKHQPGRLECYPVPTATGVRIVLPEGAGELLWLKIHNMNGELVFDISGKSVDLGNKLFFWNCRNRYGGRIAAGVYAVTAGTPSGSFTGKCVVTQ